MKLLQAPFFWFFSFSMIFFLSLDFWSWEKDTVLWLFNLPPWLFYFVGLQIILSLVMLGFAISFWSR